MEQNACKSAFFQYAALNVLGMLGLSCYILADTFFISKGLGADGLAALNLAIPVYSFIHGSGLMLGVGGATKFSVLKGQGAEKKGNQVFTNTIWTAALLAVCFLSAGIFLSPHLTLLLGADTSVFTMTNTYLRVILLFSPAFLLNDVLLCFVRNDGSPRLSMLAMLLGSFSNIALDYLFIFPLDMGIFGAVLATGFAPVISLLLLSLHLKQKGHFRFLPAAPVFHFTGTILSLGFPSLVTEAASGMVMIIFNKVILALCGNTGVAAYGIIANLSLVVTAVCTGIAQGMQPLASSAFGKGQRHLLPKLLRYALCTMLAVSLCVCFCIFTFTGPLAGIFNSDRNPQLQKLAEEGLKLYFLSVPFMGFNVILSMFFTSTQTPLPAQLLSLLRGFLLIVPMTFLLAFLAGLTGIWLTMPVTEGIVAALGAFLYLRQKKISGNAEKEGSQ